MNASSRSRDKRVVFESLLERGIVALHLDARRDGVVVPERLRSRPWLVLNFSLGYRLEDFEHDDLGASASLSFSGQPYPCRVPWTAVFAITNEARDAGYAWSDEMPEHIATAMARAQDGVEMAGAEGLRLIEGGGDSAVTAPRRGHLRRIK